MRFKMITWASIFGLLLSVGEIHADPDNNTRIMSEAAQRLSWENWEGDNHAYLLVKQETILAPVAVVFGYADNGTACHALAHALSQSQAMPGTFKCQPIF